MAVVTASIDNSLLAELDNYANKNDLDRSKVIRKAIRVFLQEDISQTNPKVSSDKVKKK